MGRTFAYFGVPRLMLFVGEAALGAFLLARFQTFIGVWGAALIRPTPLSGLVWSLVLLVAYGVFAVLRGVGLGYSPLVAVQSLVFNYYPLYLFLGIWIGQRIPDALPRLVHIVAWVHGVYGVAYVLALGHLPHMLPWIRVPLFTQPSASEVVMLGILIFRRQLTQTVPLLVLNGFVLLGTQMRAQWVAFLVGLAVLGLLRNQFRHLVKGSLIVVVLLAVLYATGAEIPSPRERGGTISVRSMVARALAPIDRSTAAEYSDEVDAYAGTAAWRTAWWQSIWRSVHETPGRALAGHGYGFPLPSVAPELHFPSTERGMSLRTPHNFFFYALGYGGWIHVGIMLAFLLSLARLLWLAYRRSGNAFGVVLLPTFITEACFSNSFESPQRAIPFYILAGLSLAAALTRPDARAGAPPARPWVSPVPADARALADA
jgi:hypothetical protein